VNSFQVDDDGIGSDKKEKAIQTAREYFKLAYSYVA
jgi:aminoglycoside phosphotransferase family enzyme